MPIYEYRCEACGAPKEAIQKMSDAPLKLCDACGAEALVRIMSRTSFVLKGSGWYATGYESSAPKSEAKSEGTEGKPGLAGDKPESSVAKSSGDAAATSAAKDS